MKYIAWTSAALFSVALAACSGDEPPSAPAPQQEAASDQSAAWEQSLSSLQDFEAASYVDEDGVAADLSALQAALPDFATLSWDAQTLDEASGASVFENLRLTINTEPAFGVVMDEARIWGFDDTLLMARLNGERLDETGTVFDRLEADGYAAFGAAGAMNAVFNFLESEVKSGDAEPVDFGVDQFDFNVEKSVTGALTLRPFEYVPLSQEQYAQMTGLLGLNDVSIDEDMPMDGLQALQLAQQFIAVARSVEVEQATARDLEMTLAINGDGIEQTVSYQMDFYGLEGLSGYDLDAVYYTGVNQAQGMLMTEPASGASGMYPDGLNIDQVYSTDFSVWEDMRLDTLAGYLARSEFPGMDERDLISLGSGTTTGFVYQMNEADILRIESASFDATEFEWLLPERLSFDIAGMSVHPEDIGEITLSFLPSGEGQDMEDVRADIEEALGLLDEHGLSEIPADIQMGASWDKESGATELRFAGQSEGFGERIAQLDITLPPYDPIAGAAAAGSLDTAFEELFEMYFSFAGARLYESDEGGYDKLFGYLHALGQQHEQEGWGATLANMPPDKLRTFLATMIRSAKGRVQGEFPPAADWIESVAAYFETSGGSLEFLAAPPEPVTPDQIEQLESADDYDALVDQLGISVTHTPE